MDELASNVAKGNFCPSCRFFEARDDVGLDGVCRRRAPHPQVSVMTMATIESHQALHVFVDWPQVGEADWCGEYDTRPPNMSGGFQRP